MGIGTIKQNKLIKFMEVNVFYKKCQSGSYATTKMMILILQ
jgi:hypothetical protein